MNVKNIINKNKVPTFSVSYFSKASPENSYSYCLQFLSAQPLLKSFQVTEVTTFSQQSISDLRQCLQWPPYCWILWFSCCSFQNSFIIWLQNHHTLLVFPLWHCFFFILSCCFRVLLEWHLDHVSSLAATTPSVISSKFVV